MARLYQYGHDEEDRVVGDEEGSDFPGEMELVQWNKDERTDKGDGETEKPDVRLRVVSEGHGAGGAHGEGEGDAGSDEEVE